MLNLQVAEHYKQVIATDVSEAQLKAAIPHPRIKYLHTPLSLSDDEIVKLVRGDDAELKPSTGLTSQTSTLS